jgi:hypothetical protein
LLLLRELVSRSRYGHGTARIAAKRERGYVK